MAIFTGTWEDGDGVPFDASAQVLHDQAGGGTVCRNRPKPANHREHKHFRRIMSYLQNRWHNVLTQANRDVWQYIGPASPIRRMETIGTYNTGWAGFVAACYAEVWWSGFTTMLGPLYESGVPFVRGISAINPTNQTATINVTYGSSFGTNPHSLMCWYQMKPFKVGTPTCWRDSMMIAMILDWNPDGGSYEYPVPLHWKVYDGKTARFMIRTRPGWAYRSDYSNSYSVPRP